MDDRKPLNNAAVAGASLPSSSSSTMTDERAAAERNITAVPNQVAGSRNSTALGRWDIVLGRGSFNSWRPGNARLLTLVDRFMNEYDNAVNRKTKTRIIQNIYNNLTERGRFLRKDEDSKEYFPVSERFAKRKISHTFRDRRRKGRRSETGRQEVARRPSTASKDDSKISAVEPTHAQHLPPRNPQAASRADSPDSPLPNESDGESSEDVSTSSSRSSLFSDRELASVLGRPSDYK